MIKLAFVDPDGQLSRSYSCLERDHPEMRIRKTYRSLDEVLRSPSLSDYDILVLSASLPGKNTRSLARSIDSLTSGTDHEPRPRVLIVGVNEDREEILSYIEAGARGYLRQSDPMEEFLATIRYLHQGQARVPPDLAQALMARLWELASRLERIRPTRKPASTLTPREREILQLLKQNLSNNEIAELLSIEVGTVKNHVHNILDKLEVSNRKQAAEAVLWDNWSDYQQQRISYNAVAD